MRPVAPDEICEIQASASCDCLEKKRIHNFKTGFCSRQALIWGCFCGCEELGVEKFAQKFAKLNIRLLVYILHRFKLEPLLCLRRVEVTVCPCWQGAGMSVMWVNMRLESEAGISDPSDDLLSGDQHSLGEIRLSHKAHQTLHSDLFCRIISKKISEG